MFSESLFSSDIFFGSVSSVTSDAIPFLKLLIPLATSPIRLEILIVVGIAIVVLGPKDFPIMLKKAGSWIGTAKRYVSNIQNEVSNLEIDEEKIDNEIKKETKKDEQ